MKHGKTHDRTLFEYAENILPEEKRILLETHLEHCSNCRGRLTEYQRDGAMLAQAAACTLPAASMPISFDRITKSRSIQRRPVLVGLVTASCFVFIATGILWHRLYPDSPENTGVSSEKVAALEKRLLALEKELQGIKEANMARTETLQLESQFRQEEMAALGLTAARQYELQGNQTLAIERYTYVVLQFENTRAAAHAKERLTELASPSV